MPVITGESAALKSPEKHMVILVIRAVFLRNQKFSIMVTGTVPIMAEAKPRTACSRYMGRRLLHKGKQQVTATRRTVPRSTVFRRPSLFRTAGTIRPQIARSILKMVPVMATFPLPVPSSAAMGEKNSPGRFIPMARQLQIIPLPAAMTIMYFLFIFFHFPFLTKYTFPCGQDTVYSTCST